MDRDSIDRLLVATSKTAVKTRMHNATLGQIHHAVGSIISLVTETVVAQSLLASIVMAIQVKIAGRCDKMFQFLFECLPNQIHFF